MTMLRIARLILTIELVLGVFLSFLLDWSSNHLLHPEWHPHARYHGALLLFFLAGASGSHCGSCGEVARAEGGH